MSTVKRKAPGKKKATPKKVVTMPRKVPVKAVPTKPTKKQRQVRGLDAEGKARSIEECAKENGWWAKVTVDKDIIKVVAKNDDGRYKDTISGEWIGGQKGTLLYIAEGGQSIRFRNLAAVKHHIDGSAIIKRPTEATRHKRARKQIFDNEGNVVARKDEEGYKPIGADIPDYFYHITAKRPRNRADLAPLISFTTGFTMKDRRAELEAEGYSVTVVECCSFKGDGCEVCDKIAAEMAKPKPHNPAVKPKPTVAKKATTRRVAKKATARMKP